MGWGGDTGGGGGCVWGIVAGELSLIFLFGGVVLLWGGPAGRKPRFVFVMWIVGRGLAADAAASFCQLLRN